VVDAAKRKKGANIPPRLVYAWWCDKYRTLPRIGGIDDQDYRELYLNDVLPRIYEAVSNWRAGGGAKLSQPDQAVITWLVKVGAM
jgi:hypothetical protein